MNKNQEKALFGNVLPEEINMFAHAESLMKVLNINYLLSRTEANTLLTVVRSQRDAIGMLIEMLIDHQEYNCIEDEDIGTELNPFIDGVGIVETATDKLWPLVKKEWKANQ